ncbi:radical SAM protein [Candidatus Laterigemmans baculatus]|uniref:radical SAM protein n=1 Tax=Candidatus Laterigemmans baculatus TaxID=2770505 RepID=UPI0013DCBBCF|nr:radical SAM protein [Candidatus Laterigemmans baculatus]
MTVTAAKTAYSPLKVLHHPAQLASAGGGAVAPPVHVQLIISDLCNHNCSFCAHRMDGYINNETFSKGVRLAAKGTNNPVRMIPLPKCEEIVDDAAEMGVRAFQISGGGEPTVHPHHVDIFERVLDRGLDLALVTNGQILKDRAVEHLQRATWVRVSVDAGRAETYASVREVSAAVFDRVWGNIARLAALSDGPEVGVGFVVTRENWREIGEFFARAADSGADNVRLSAFFQDHGVDYYRDIFDELRSSIDDARRQHESESFRIYDNFGDRYDDMRVGFPDYQHCGYQYFTTYIGADLKLYRCCNLSYSGRGVVGDLAGTRFRDLWAAAAGRRRDFDPSQNCPRCRFNKINETIQYATGSGGRHANFT